MFGFVFLPGLPRAADQNVCKQSWAAQAQLCYRKCLFPAKTDITASRPFICLQIPTYKIPGFNHQEFVFIIQFISRLFQPSIVTY